MQVHNPGGVATYGYMIYNDGKSKKLMRVVGSGAGMTTTVAERAALGNVIFF
ncbi:MAG: hypothetical protein WC391_10100 [Methanoregula sp.]